MLSHQFKLDYKKKHYQLRARHCILDLQLDNKLSQIAQDYATNNGHQENLYRMGTSVIYMIKRFRFFI
jgi:hypothetical protein